ncbi:MAG: (Fe-S)-binding protein [Caldilineales bacterium]|nr:(Fe-S)-binding protein [Caldilineales bacterium]MDW8319494.1 (Fe-S)-binding protein [Anaerolineae bacterium]
MATNTVIATTDNCRYCLMCRHVCPVGHVTRLETLTPHGWGLTIASVRRGLLRWDEATVTALYQCADCGTCRAHCVTDQPLPEAIAEARAEVVAAGLAPAAALAVAERLAAYGNPYVEQVPQPPLGEGAVALFVGDEVAYRCPGLLDAALKLLAALDIRPALVGRGRNNGYLASSLGFPDLARSLAQATLAELAAVGAHQLLVLSPADYYAFHRLHQERLALTRPRHLEVTEVVNLLARALEMGDVAFRRAEIDAPYAYLDPTHTVRVDGRWDAPRQLLTAVLPGPPRELFWRRERTHPTGSTALQFTQPDLAATLNTARLEDAQRTGVRLLVTEAAGDLAVLTPLAPRFGLELRSLYELLADHLAGSL